MILFAFIFDLIAALISFKLWLRIVGLRVEVEPFHSSFVLTTSKCLLVGQRSDLRLLLDQQQKNRRSRHHRIHFFMLIVWGNVCLWIISWMLTAKVFHLIRLLFYYHFFQKKTPSLNLSFIW
jgi:hypothetical protein